MSARKKDDVVRSRYIEPDPRKADRIFSSFEIRLSKSILDRDAKHEAFNHGAILGSQCNRHGPLFVPRGSIECLRRSIDGSGGTASAASSNS